MRPPYFESSGSRVKQVILNEKIGYGADQQDTSLNRERTLDKQTRKLKIKFIISIILSSFLMYIAMGSCVGLPVPETLIDASDGIMIARGDMAMMNGIIKFTEGSAIYRKAKR